MARSLNLVVLVTLINVQDTPRWTAYTGMMISSCISNSEPDILTERWHVVNCFGRQVKYLQCGALTAESGTTELLEGMRKSTMHTPCGRGMLAPQAHHGRRFVEFVIKVHDYFQINATFVQFNLPMPHGQCELLETSESVELRAPEQRSIAFCGQRPPFSVRWKSHVLYLMYQSIQGYPTTGRFELTYQVCEPSASPFEEIKVLTSGTTAHLFFNTTTVVSLKGIGHRAISKSTARYSFHIIAQRVHALDVAIRKPFTYRGPLEVRAFEGPSPAEILRHPMDQILLEEEWIFFYTFQAYLQLDCNTQCSKLLVGYAFQIATHTAVNVNLTSDTLWLQYPSPGCRQDGFDERMGSLILCVYSIGTNDVDRTVKVSFDEIALSGPDYLGDESGEHTCLLGGVTVMDKVRLSLLLQPEKHAEIHGQRLEDHVIDNIFPEITVCHQVPFLEGNGEDISYELPLKTFTSMTSDLFVIMYAYGHHIDLNRTRLAISVSSSFDVGVQIGCPVIEEDGYLSIGLGLFFRHEIFQLTKAVACQTGSNVLLYHINPRNSYILTIMYCGSTKRQTRVYLISPLGDAKSKRRLLVQTNRHPTVAQSLACSIFEKDSHLRFRHRYALKAKASHSIACQESSFLYGIYQVDQRADLPTTIHERFSGNTSGIMLQVALYPKCHWAQINIAAQCQSLTSISATTITEYDIMESFTPKGYSFLCDRYDLPEMSNTKGVSYQLHVPDGSDMHLLRTSIMTNKKLGSLTAYMLDLEVASWQFSLVLTYDQCPSACRSFELSIAYTETTTGSIVWMMWDVNMGEKNEFAIDIQQIALGEWVVYLTRITNNLTCVGSHCQETVVIKSVKPTPSIQNTRLSGTFTLPSESMPITSSVRYSFVWRDGQYTWMEAESVCEKMGMVLASISSNDEFSIVTDLLSGEGNPLWLLKSVEHPIFTPCRLEASICTVYIGLQLQVGQYQVNLQYYKSPTSSSSISQTKCLFYFTERKVEVG